MAEASKGTNASQGAVSAYAAAGADVTNYWLDIATGELVRRATLTLPARVQYIWPHASLPILYAACADRGGDAASKPFYLCALLRDEAGDLTLHGDIVTLPERPIHLTTDNTSAHVLVIYGGKPGMTVYTTLDDGAIGREIPRASTFDFGTKPHHVRMAPLDDRAVLVARGAKGFGKPSYVEGAFKQVRFDAGQVEIVESVTPAADRTPRGFNPRNVDFHPTRPLMFATLEAQNELAVFAMNGSRIEATPLFTHTILQHPEAVRKRQDGGEVHVHPDGRHVYVVNRNDGYVEERSGPSWLNPDPIPEFPGGENNIAVFELDELTARPVLVQHVDTQGLDARTIAIDRSGTILLSADIAPMLVRKGEDLVTVPASLAVFRIGDDGRLTLLRRHDLEAGPEKVLWMGIVG